MKPHILIFNPDQWRGDVLGHVGNPGADAQSRQAAAASACAVLRGRAGIAPNFPEYAINRFPGLDLNKIDFDPKFPQALKNGTAWWCQVPASTIRSRVARD